MKNLGKIIILIFFSALLNASIESFVDHKTVTLGDSVSFRIEVKGNDITPPNIDTLCGVDVTGTSTQQSIQIINGSITKSYSYIYTFEPTQDCTIEPVPVKVDGEIQRTKPIKIKVTTQPQNDKNSDFTLKLSTDKKEVFVGETFYVTLTFRQRLGANAIDSKFFPPKLDGFWIKSESQPQKSSDGEFVTTKVRYKMAAQREGVLHIKPAKMKIAVRIMNRGYWDTLMPSIKWKTYYSNALEIKVKAPPAGIKLVGDFDINVKTDKTVIHPNEALNCEIIIKGSGNIEDIEVFKPYIQNANVFEEKPILDQKNGIFKEKIAFVADSDFDIPSFFIRYFNPKTKKIETKKTKPIHITVKGGVKKKEHFVIKKQPQQEKTAKVQNSSTSNIDSSFAITWIIVSFFAGLIMGALSVYFLLLKSKIDFSKKRRYDIKDPKMLFVKLLPYKDDKEVKEILDILEENIYGNNKRKIDKKQLKEILKRYDI